LEGLDMPRAETEQATGVSEGSEDSPSVCFRCRCRVGAYTGAGGFY